jgi:serine/threonine protein kinase
MHTSSESSSDRNPVEALADDFLRRQRGGERPTLEEYCRCHPELADEIREVFPVLIRMEDLRSDGPEESTGGMGVHTATRLARLGDYRILREVGRGGMGVVYEAEQESLGRRVALKVLPDAALSDAKQVLRFEREARAAARLHHTNIVPVFGVGKDEGHHYYVMQFIPGMGLDAVLDELRRLRRGQGGASPSEPRAMSRSAVSAVEVAQAIVTGRFLPAERANGAPSPDTTLAATDSAPLDYRAAVARQSEDSSVISLPGASAESLARSDPDRTIFRSVARIGLQVAEALEYANRQGILHRDVKPSNLLLDPKGNVWVADFGLAKASDTEDLTHSGDIIGTVRYMAPERFAGKCDARSDVYALGLTLYELLALRPAFASPDRHELMRRVMSEQPERLRGLVPHLPRDLETVVHKAIAREPIQRYPSAAALAEDLQRFLDDKPIKARRVTAVEQAWRWARRNPAVAALAASLLVALVVGLVGVTWQWRQAAANLAVAVSANRKAQARFGLAMEAVRVFTTGASEDVILKEKALEGLRKKLLGQSQTFYEKLRGSLQGETDRPSRAALADAMFDAGVLYARVNSSREALETLRQSLSLRTAMITKQRGDPAAWRELGRIHLACAEILDSLKRVDEARAELIKAREAIGPLARELPAEGGVRRLEAETESLEGRLLIDAGRPNEGRSALGRAQALYEDLIQDDPPYTLPTASDGPTEYRRGLAEVLVRIGDSLSVESRHHEALTTMEELQRVSEELLTGPFAADSDRQRLGLSYFRAGLSLSFVGRFAEAIQASKRGLAILQQLSDANPAVTSYKMDVARSLTDIGAVYGDRGDYPNARRFALRGRSVIRSWTPDEREKGARYEAINETTLAYCALGVGRIEEALHHVGRSVTVMEEAARAHPDYLDQQVGLGLALSNLAMIELFVGHAVEARRAATRLRAIVEPVLREHPDLRYVRQWQINALQIEAYLDLKAGRLPEAARTADLAAAELERLKLPLSHQERFSVAIAHTLTYLLGRPAGPGRPAEAPGFPARADRAVADVLEANRMGYRIPNVVVMIDQVLGGRPELQLLLMDQVFPAEPFQPVPTRDGDNALSDSDVGGAIP